MQSKLFLTILTLSFCLAACKGEVQTDISGKWKTEYTVRSGFSVSENSDTSDLFLNVRQKVSYEFFKDGRYTKYVSQELNSVENLKKITVQPKEEIAREINNNLTISGMYQTKGNLITFSAEEIELSDGTEFAYEDYRDYNEFIDPARTAETFELKDGNLYISDLKYEKDSEF